MSDLKVKQTTGLKGEITVPGDKSISHRSIILGSLAKGETTVKGFLASADCRNTARAFMRMGVSICWPAPDTLVIHGAGLKGLKESGEIIDVGNSGTSIRLLSGVLAGQPFYSVITGDESIRNRPMKRVVEPLMEMGALIYGREGGNKAPLSIVGGELFPISYKSPVASAQVKSAILLAGLFADGETAVTEPTVSRNHSELMLKAFGADLTINGTTVTVSGYPDLRAQEVLVPGDISSAAYWLVAGLVMPHSEITIKNVGINPTRTGILDVLKAMGGDISISNERIWTGEPVADITVRTSELQATEIRGQMIPRLIDEIPIIAVAAALASGDTIIADAGELRVKESDRIATVAGEISKFGASIEETADGMIIHGVENLRGATCESHEDHRIAMSCAIAGLTASGETTVHETDCISTSYPQFEEDLQSIS